MNLPRPQRQPGRMNKLEARYEREVLIPGKMAGEILHWTYEGHKFRLAHNTFYTPDFNVYTPEFYEQHEVKGHWEDDARVKIKVAQQMHPYFRFCAVQWSKRGGWTTEYFKVV